MHSPIPVFQNMNGTPPGQHWLLGVGAGTPQLAYRLALEYPDDFAGVIWPYLLMTPAALGFKIGLE